MCKMVSIEHLIISCRDECVLLLLTGWSCSDNVAVDCVIGLVLKFLHIIYRIIFSVKDVKRCNHLCCKTPACTHRVQICSRAGELGAQQPHMVTLLCCSSINNMALW